MSIMKELLDLINDIQGTRIKLSEEFRIKGSDLTLKFHLGTLFSQEKGFSWCEDDGKYLKKIITEKNVIETHKKRWKPDYGQEYYIPKINVASLYDNCCWQGDYIDKQSLKKGIIFETPEKAVEMSRKLLDYIKELRENE